IFFAYSFLFFCSFLFTVPAHLDFSTLSLHDALPISYGVGALFAGLWHTTIPQFAPHVALGWSMYMVLNSVINESTQVLYRARSRSEEHTSELQSRFDLVCRLLLEKINVPCLDQSPHQ